MILTKAQRKGTIEQLDEAEPDIIRRAEALADTVPGIVKALRSDLKELRAEVNSDRPFRFAIQSRFMNIMSRLRYAEDGLYLRVDGKAWVYA